MTENFPGDCLNDADRSAPADKIVRASLGIEDDEQKLLLGWRKRSIFEPTPITSHPSIVTLEVVGGSGTIRFFDTEGGYVGTRILEPGITCEVAAGTRHSFYPSNGLLVIQESYTGSDESDSDLYVD